jgi:hypothetical protein
MTTKPIKELEELVGETITKIKLISDGKAIAIQLDDWSIVILEVYAVCCSESWVEEIEVPPLPAKVVGYDAPWEQTLEGTRQEVDIQYRETWRLSTGHLVVTFRNSSNGFYGGSLDVVTDIDWF